MTNVTSTELNSLFAAIDENTEKALGLKSQIKMLDADSNEQYKNFAKEFEINVADLKKAYKYWKAVQESADGDVDEDFFTLCAIIDNEKLED